MEAKKRPDRAIKLKARRILQETIVKCSLKKSLQGNDKQNIIDSINNRMKICSYRTFWASVGINLLIREAIDQHEDLTKVQFPEFWDQTFVRQMMLGTDDAHKKIHCIEDLHKRHPKLLKRHERHLGDRNIYSSAAMKLSTNIKNHLRVNFDRTIRKYLYNASGLKKEEALNVLIDILGFKIRNKNEVGKERVKEVKRVTSLLRDILGLEEGISVNKQWIKKDDNLQRILRLFIMTNRALEDKDQKLISILPICRIKSHFITIDTSSMMGILQELGIIKNSKSVLEDELWNSIININHVKGKNKTFTGTIDTDGLVVNIHFQRPKMTTDKSDKKNDFQHKRVIGVDPGRTNIFTMAEIDRNNGSIKKYKLTRNQYYSKSGMFKARKETAKWNLGVKSDLEKMSRNSPKSIYLSKFLMYINTVTNVQKRLWKEYLKKRWRRQRFRLYSGKKRTFAKFLNSLGPPNDIVLAFGNAKFAPGGKGEISVPTSRAFKECSSRFKIEIVDEFRTSKINYRDDQILEIVATNNKRINQIRGLLWCRSSDNTNPSKGKFVDRDINAALNIRRCIQSRPLILTRSKDNVPINQKIGKILRF